ncbi:MAG TPA: hypothetical protein VJG83_02365 [archaeon]|nr:hypothetical protein [archaeon]
MPSTIEYLALVAVAIVLVISVVQAAQISGLNEKITQQNAALASLALGGTNTTVGQGAAAAQQALAPSQGSASQQMVGGC